MIKILILSLFTATASAYDMPIQKIAGGGGGGSATSSTLVADGPLQMGAYGVFTSSDISASVYQINGSTVISLVRGTGSMGIGISAGNISYGADNTFIGYKSGLVNTSAGENTAIGSNAGAAQTTGTGNVLVGFKSGFALTNKSYNTFLGNQAGYGTVESNNVAVGYNAMYGAGAKKDNVCIGYKSGFPLTTGNNNTLIGSEAGYTITTGTGNIIIGSNINTPAAGTNNYLNIGDAIFGDMTPNNSTMTFVGAVSATEFIDRTPYPETLELAYAEVDSITRKADNSKKVDHSKLHPGLKASTKMPRLDHYATNVVSYTEDGIEKTREEQTPVYVMEVVEGRNMSETISALVEVVKDLRKRIDALEGK
jgi:hypothetical protein